ncbi:MAG: helical backbone metal receptor [Alphaproteobacteria bacterium]|nr:helical backbone metal receptor [Alphaproteobacteria bacterium]
MLTDAAGKQHVHAGSGARVVSLIPSLTEMFFDLGLSSLLVGRSSGGVEASNPAEYLPVVGNTKAIDMMKLAELGPSHVLVNVDDTAQSVIDDVVNLGVEIVVTHCAGPEDNLTLFSLMGEIFGGTEAAEKQAAALQREIDAAGQLAASRPVKNVLYLTWKEPWISVAEGTYAANMLALVGLRTMCRNPQPPYPEVTIDQAMLAQADLVLFGHDPFQFEDEDVQDFQLEYGIGSKPKVDIVEGRNMFWYGTRAIDGLRELSALAAQL